MDNALIPVCGDVHTAVRWYLEWIANGKDLAVTVKGLVRIPCFNKMAMSAPSRSPERAKEMLAIPHWRGALTICIAFAYQINIMHMYGADCYKSTFDSKDPVRNYLKLPWAATSLQVSSRSLCHSKSCSPSPWIVYAGTSRSPYDQSVTPLPRNVACWFTRLPVTWYRDLEFLGI